MKKIIIFLSTVFSMLIFGCAVQAATINVPILCYHSVSTNPLDLENYTISKEEFKADVAYFKSKGYNFITPSELPSVSGDYDNIILSFDDGYKDFYTNVFPILKEYNAKAVVYIIGSRIGKTGYLNQWEIKEMDESGLVEIGNHTDILHFRAKDLLISWYNDPFMLEEAAYDIGKCNQRLYEIIGHYPQAISYPYGAYSEALERKVKDELMFLTSVTTVHGIVKYSSNVYNPMKRIYRIHEDTPQIIEQRINNLK